MNDADVRELLKELGEVKGGFDALRAEVSDLRQEVKDLRGQVAAGGGAVKALMWLGTFALLCTGAVIALLNYLKH